MPNRYASNRFLLFSFFNLGKEDAGAPVTKDESASKAQDIRALPEKSLQRSAKVSAFRVPPCVPVVVPEQGILKNESFS